jgi:hypothetical protein
VLRPTSAFLNLVCLIQFLSQCRQGPSRYPLPCASPLPGSYSAIIVARIDSSALSVPILCEWLQGVAGIALDSADQKTQEFMI